MDVYMAPSMVRLLNSARTILNGKDDWGSFIEHVQKGLQALNQLGTSINYLTPTIYREPGVPEAKFEINKAIEEQEQLLVKALEIGETKDIEALPPTMSAIDDNAIRIAVVMTELEGKKETAFRASSSSVLNDLIIIGIELSRASINKDQLETRLPELQRYISYVEDTVTRSMRRFPEQTILWEFFSVQLKRLKQGAGGIFLFLEEENIEDLVVAISLLDRAGLDLWAAFSALNQLYIQYMTYSGDALVDDAFHFLDSYRKGAATKKDMLDTLRRLKKDLDREAYEVSLLKTRVFIKPAVMQEFLPQLDQNLKRLLLILAYMKDNITNPDNLEEALRQYDIALERQSNTRKQLGQKLEERSGIEEAAQFEELLDLIRDVYEEHAPDIRLDNKVNYLDEFQDAIRRRLALEERRNPKLSDTIEQFFEHLDRQSEGIDLVLEYLETGNKTLLPEAYRIIQESTQQFIEFNRALETKAEMEKGADFISCPYCHAESPKESRNCANCGRIMPSYSSGEQQMGETLDITESKGTLPAATAETALPDNIEFIRQVVEDTAQGIVPFEESAEMLMPFWEKIKEVEEKLNEHVSQVVKRAQDPELTRDFEGFKDSLNYFQSSMNEILAGIQERNVSILKSNLPAVLEAGEELFKLHNKFETMIKGQDK